MIEAKILRFWLIAGSVLCALSAKPAVVESVYEEVPFGERCLGSCICYEDSKTVNCSGKDYDYVPYDIPENTLVLDLSHNTIGAVSSVNLQNLHNVTSLDLSYNEISLLGEQSFNTMEHLRVLKLTNNARSLIINPGTFASLRNLEELYIEYTAAQGLFQGIFTAQDKLTLLDIDNTNIFPSSFSNITFEGLTSLRELSIAGSYLYEVPMTVMWPFRDVLKKLSMRFSSRMTGIGINENQKPDFPGLEELDFSYCQIQYIGPEAFSGLPKLKILDLTANFIFTIPPRGFAGLSSLQILNLSQASLITFPLLPLEPVSETLLELRMSKVYYSEIQNVTSSVSEGYLARLETLWIEEGNLARIANDSFFNNLRSLKYLSAANNQFESLPTGALLHLESLETADFSGNPITR